MDEIKWIVKDYKDLTTDELYDMMNLRQVVFVEEQDCVYIDADFKDKKSIHVNGYLNDTLIAHTRIVEPGVSYSEASIGRVVTSPEVRRTGIGKILMQKSIEALECQFKSSKCRISAQTYLVKFYSQFGFEVCSEEYLEDGLPHYEMIR